MKICTKVSNNEGSFEIRPRLSRSAPENDSALPAMSSRHTPSSRGVLLVRCLKNYEDLIIIIRSQFTAKEWIVDRYILRVREISWAKTPPFSELSRDPEEKGGVFTLYPGFAGSETGASWEYCFSRYPGLSPTGCDLDSTVKITPVGDILEKMPSSRQEQNRQNRGIMGNGHHSSC